MITPLPKWRPALIEDCAAIIQLAQIIHPNFPEQDAVFASHLHLFPPGCWLAVVSDRAVGYALSHPDHLGHPHPLDTPLTELAPDADCLYLHDLAILSDQRGGGLGRILVDHLIQTATSVGLHTLALTAVNGSAPYWAKLGFQPHAPYDPQALQSYGPDACYMSRSLTSKQD